MWVVTQPFPSHGGEILCGGHKILGYNNKYNNFVSMIQ